MPDDDGQLARSRFIRDRATALRCQFEEITPSSRGRHHAHRGTRPPPSDHGRDGCALAGDAPPHDRAARCARPAIATRPIVATAYLPHMCGVSMDAHRGAHARMPARLHQSLATALYPVSGRNHPFSYLLTVRRRTVRRRLLPSIVLLLSLISLRAVAPPRDAHCRATARRTWRCCCHADRYDGGRRIAPEDGGRKRRIHCLCAAEPYACGSMEMENPVPRHLVIETASPARHHQG